MAKRPTDARNTWAWRRLRDQVVREEPNCWLRLPCCTGLSTTADHVLTVKARPDLILERTNLRGACRACNNSRKDTPVEELGIELGQERRAWVITTTQQQVERTRNRINNRNIYRRRAGIPLDKPTSGRDEIPRDS